MNKQQLENFTQSYNPIIDSLIAEKSWFANCDQVVLLAHAATIPSLIRPNTLYLQQKPDGQISMLGPKPIARSLDATQKERLFSAGFHFKHAPKKTLWLRVLPKLTVVITDQAVISQVIAICAPVAHSDVLNNERLLGQFLQVFLSTPQLPTIIDYADFLKAMQTKQQWLNSTGDENTQNKGLTSAFYIEWIQQSHCDTCTFMGTAPQDIPLSQLVWLNNRFESAEELLAFSKHNVHNGNTIFLDPNSLRHECFSLADQRILAAHPTCQAFIKDYLTEQQRLANLILPEAFFDLLHTYLNALHTIGQQTQPWSFPDETRIFCDDARKLFFDSYRVICSEEQNLALANSIQVHVPLRRSLNQCVSAKFAIIAEGIYPYDCLITQQIYLWAMVRNHRPNIVTPSALINHPQADVYNLGHKPRPILIPATAVTMPLTTTSVISIPPPDALILPAFPNDAALSALL